MNNNWLIHSLLNNNGFMVARMGNVEATALFPPRGGITSGDKKENIYEQMFTNAGFYGDEKIFKKWKNEYIKALMSMDCHLDVVSCPSFVVCGDLLTKLNIWKPTLVYLERIDFWINTMEIFKKFNKKIGIVSYFAPEMKKQYKKINRIFTHTDLTNMNLTFIESYNTIKGNEEHKNWLDTFEKLKNKIDNAPQCDIYLVSCGCYGLPLCNYIKSKNLNSIYVGGLLQMLFGLKGKRWMHRDFMNKYINDEWKFPEKKPKNNNLVEGGCYWG